MRDLRQVKGKHNLWTRIALILTSGFILLAIVIWLFGNQLLSESENSVLEHRLTIAQMAANQIDRLLGQVIRELEQATLFTDFDPADPDLEAEVEILEDLVTSLDPAITGVIFLDRLGNVILARSSDRYLYRTDLSGLLPAMQGILPQRSSIGAPYHGGSNEPLVAPVIVPIKGGDRILGLLVAGVDLTNPIIGTTLSEATALGETAHAVLVDDQGRVIYSTFDLPILSTGEHVTFYRRAIAEGRPVVEEVPFELDIPGEPLGHHHIMALIPLKTASWGVSVGGDVIGETFADVWKVFFGLAVFSLITFGLIWATTLFSTRRLLTPVGNAILKSDFNRRITEIEEWDELIQFIVRIPSQIGPVSDARLALINSSTGINEFVSEWCRNGCDAVNRSMTHFSFEMCTACSNADDLEMHSPIRCAGQEGHAAFDWVNSFCLPLKHQDKPVGILHFSIQNDAQLLRSQVEILTDLAPEMAMAVESFQLQRSNQSQAEITQLERQRIARDLHDTLGQKLTFLRLRLDQISNEITAQDIEEVQQDLKRMRTVANEAYEQIRVSLKELQSESQTDLEADLLKLGKQAAERTQLEFGFTSDGKPVKIPFAIKRRILFICMEAFNNIEQHANASKITIHLGWYEKELNISIRDDGYGFEPTNTLPAGHYGIDIMHERAQIIGGKLFITSEPGAGTEVLLWLPIQSL